jgi:N6-adenosine-specific RNA methylase IME4
VSELGGFGVILADPPWAYDVAGGRGGADKHYPTMGLGELCMMPVEELAAPDAVIFMWATWPTLPDAFGLMRAWGFKYKNCGLLWAKTNKLAPSPFVGLGHWTRGNTEPCLMGVRGKPERVDKAVQQLLVDDLIVAPVGAHSAKPSEARDRIIRLMGDIPSIELFARGPAPGWECFGNEVSSTVTLEG